MAILLTGTTIGGHSAIHAGNLATHGIITTSNIGSYAITSIPTSFSSITVTSSFDTASNDIYASMRVIRNNSAITDGMYIGYGNSGSGITRIFGGGSTTGALVKATDYTYEPGSFRAPIFYDSDNTTYYFDGNSTTSLRTRGSWRSDSSDWDGEYAGKIQYHSNHWYFQSGNLWLFRNAGGANVFQVDQSGNGTFNGDIYLGTRGTWLSSYLNQDVRTSASPSFSTVNLNTLNASDTNARYYVQSTNGVPSNNLGSPTVTEMALFDEQFNNKTAFYDNTALSFWTSSDGTNYTEYTGFDTTTKKRFLGGDLDSGVVIPNQTNRFRIELENTAGYVFLNQLYIYWSSNSHSTKVHIWVRRCDNNQWYQWTDSNTQVSSWPGHLYLPFNGIPFYPGALASNGHFNRIRIEFIPTWSTGDYSTLPINLMRMQIWGGYPAGKRNIYSTDENQNVNFPAEVGSTSFYATNFRASNAYYLNGTSYYLNSSNGGIYTNARFESASTIHASGGNSSNWSTAYGWGNHASAGYITSSALSSYLPLSGGTLTGDLTFIKAFGSKLLMGSGTSESAIGNGGIRIGRTDTNYTHGSSWSGTSSTMFIDCSDVATITIHDSGHRLVEYMTYDGAGTNTIFTGRDIGWGTTNWSFGGNVAITGSLSASGYNKSNWDSAYSWGNHASVGYLTSSALSSYLPLSGGTMSGHLNISYNIASPSNYYSGLQAEIMATSGTAGIALHRSGYSHVGIYHDSINELKFNFNGGTPILPATAGTLWGSGNLTNLNQLTNGPGYVTSSGSVNYATTAGSAPNGSNINQFYNVSAGVGNGLSFWNGSSAYKISMGVGSLYQYGPVSDYSIKMQMNDGDTGRGFTWGRESYAPIAALNSTSGDMEVAGYYKSYGYRGNGNVGGTGNASWHPDGIYCGSTMWQYGTMYKNNTGIYDVSEFKLNAGPVLGTYNTRNLIVKAHDSNDVMGILGQKSGGGFAFQIYGDGSNYGFLNGAWASWDIRKAVSGAMYMNNNDSYYLHTNSTSNFYALNIQGSAVVHAGNIGSQSVSYASTAGSADQIDGRGFVNTGSNNATYADSINSNGISYVAFNISLLGQTDGALYSQAYDSAWQHQIYGDYRTGQIVVRGKLNGTWQAWRTVIDSSTIGSQSVSYATTAGTANAVAWGNVSSKPSLVMYYQGFTLDANTMDGNSTGFTYSVNAPYTGPIARFSETGYSLQLNAAYSGGGTGIAFRTRNGDAGSFNPWRVLLNDANYTSYSPSLTGSGASGTWGINVTGSAGSVAWTNVSSRPTALSQFTNDLGNYGGWITSSGSISGNAATATNVAWTGVTGRPTALSQFSNDLGNYGGWLTTGGKAADSELLDGIDSSRIVYGNGARGKSVNMTGSSANTLDTANASGFYYGTSVTGMPNTDWWNWVSVTGNDWATSDGYGYQMAGSFWGDDFRLRRLTSGSWASWVSIIHSGNIGSQSVSYANSAGSASTAGSATSAIRLTRNGYITSEDWNGYYINNNLIGASVAAHSGPNRPLTSYNYGGMLSWFNSGEDCWQMYFPENSDGGSAAWKKLHYRTGWNGTWGPWRIVVDMVGNVSTIAGSNASGLEIHSNVGYNQDPLTYLLLRGQADTSWKSFKVRLTGDAGGQDIEFRRIAENGADARMFYVPRGANQVIFEYQFVQGSDSRLKDNIIPITNSLDKVKSLRGVEFDWNSGVNEGTHDVGLIAQDVEAVLPEAVTTQEDGYKNLAYTKVIPLLVEAMKEQQAMIDALKAEIELLKNK